MLESGPRPAVSTSLGNLLEMRILRLHRRATESKPLGWGPESCVLTSPPEYSDARLSLRTSVPDHSSGLYNQTALGFKFLSVQAP